MKSNRFCSVHQSQYSLPTGTTATAQVSSLAVSTPTPGCAHVLAEKESEKAGIFSSTVGKKEKILLFAPCGKLSRHKNRVQMLGSRNGTTNIPYREISRKLPLLVNVQSPLQLGLRNLAKCLRSTRIGKLLGTESKALKIHPLQTVPV